MKKIMSQKFMNYLLGFITNNNFFGFTNFAPARTESEGAFFLDSVVIVSGEDSTTDGFPQAAFVSRLEKFVEFSRRFFNFFAAKDFNVKFSVTFVFDDRRAFGGKAAAKFENFLNNFFDQPGFENFDVSVVAFDEFFGDGKSFEFNTRVKFAAFDINAEFPFDRFDFSNEFGFFFFDARQQEFAFPFDFGFSKSALEAV